MWQRSMKQEPIWLEENPKFEREPPNLASSLAVSGVLLDAHMRGGGSIEVIKISNTYFRVHAKCFKKRV